MERGRSGRGKKASRGSRLTRLLLILSLLWTDSAGEGPPRSGPTERGTWGIPLPGGHEMGRLLR